ncbi:hypothetical protein [Teichococcus aestuarii]|uniref:hypothetical protein n=1 Tax=Teichococcus aestuarii TaxID=568898 RepID=UPI0011B1E816|nr:hypothetical protein [Pseudoroseomonas aestuarii]
MSERIQLRKAPGRGLYKQQAKAIASHARIRSDIEHVFAAQEHRMALFVRTVGVAIWPTTSAAWPSSAPELRPHKPVAAA